MYRAVHPSGGMDSSNSHRWRGKRLHHHGDGVREVVCTFLQSHLAVVTRCI